MMLSSVVRMPGPMDLATHVSFFVTQRAYRPVGLARTARTDQRYIDSSDAWNSDGNGFQCLSVSSHPTHSRSLGQYGNRVPQATYNVMRCRCPACKMQVEPVHLQLTRRCSAFNRLGYQRKFCHRCWFRRYLVLARRSRCSPLVPACDALFQRSSGSLVEHLGPSPSHRLGHVCRDEIHSVQSISTNWPRC